jgi:hypothetical protein
MLNHHLFVLTILHVQRKLAGVAPAMLKADRAFHSPMADYSPAKENSRSCGNVLHRKTNRITRLEINPKRSPQVPHNKTG